MLRPASSSGVYMRISGASSTVSPMVKRGAISTKPPTLAAAMIAITKPIVERSSLRWNSSGMSLFPGYGRDYRHIRLACRRKRHGSYRHPDVVAADHRADQEKQ